MVVFLGPEKEFRVVLQF